MDTLNGLNGQKIRGYEILEKLGQGGYGAVYKAVQPDVNREVAVKVVLPEHVNQPEFALRFAIEARLVAKLEHPYIIPLYDYWQDASGAYLVMRWLPANLRMVLKQQGALSLSQTVRLVDQLAEALSVAHQSNVIHRDLKPENILLDERGNAYLSDFGIAKILDNDTQITGQDALVGTPAYLSPEQCRSEPVTPQSDLYSLGVMLYELLTGEHPFAGTPPGVMILKHLQEPLPLLSAARSDLPADLRTALDEVIQQATAKNPAARFPDAASLAMALHDVAHLTPPPAAVKPVNGYLAPVLFDQDTPAGTTDRNRYAMLQNVRKFWIEGVLENSLHGAALIELGLQEQMHQVNSPWDVVLRKYDGEEQTLPPGTSIVDIHDRLNGKMLILGDPGSGKTTLLLELTRDLLYRASVDDRHPIPVIFNLSSWAAERKPLTAWLIDELNTRYQVPRQVAAEWVAQDELILLLDGLDEVAANYRDACVNAINAYRQEHGFVDVVVCSRIRDYEALTNRLKLNGAIVLQPLDDRQIEAYLTALGQEMNPLRAALAEDEALREMAQSPLMLSILALAYRGNSARDLLHYTTPEERRRHIFQRYIDRMFNRRIDHADYSPEQTMQYLTWLARNMVQRAQTIFYIEGLQPDWLTRRSDRFSYTLMVALLHGLGFALITAPCSLFFLGPMIAYLVTVVGSSVLFTANLLDTYQGKIQPVERLRWSWSNLLNFTPRRLITASLLGIMAGIIWISATGLRIGFIMGVMIFIAVASLDAGFVSDQVSNKITPNEGIRRSFRNAWQPTFTAAAIIMLPICLLVGWQFSVGNALVLAFGGAVGGVPLNKAGTTIVRHVVLRYRLYRNGSIPLNYARFLDYASERVLMRRVGGGYIFIHRLLLEYFASL